MPKLRFDSNNLQERFTHKLREAGHSFGLDSEGSVLFNEEDRSSINDVAHTIRDGCFKWYFNWWNTVDGANRFERALKDNGLRYELEHHEEGKVFLLPKIDQAKHQGITAVVMDDDVHITNEQQGDMKCSFCDRGHGDVDEMIARDNISICNICVASFYGLMTGRDANN